MKKAFLLFLLVAAGFRSFAESFSPASVSADGSPRMTSDDCSRASSDSVYSKFDSLLVRFYGALETENLDSKTYQLDALIGSCGDSLLRQHVATAIFDHYKDSPIMGEEAVAIHVFDRWFADSTVVFSSEWRGLDAKMFADFNRSSLVGERAPVISLCKPCGGRRSLPSRGRVSLLFFYDASCGKCRMEAALFPALFKTLDFDVDLYAVYCGQQRRSWREFRRSLKTGSRYVHVYHLWDPKFESDYIRQYGVIGTPKIFLVEPGGLIVGRRLEIDNVKQLLPLAGGLRSVFNF